MLTAAKSPKAPFIAANRLAIVLLAVLAVCSGSLIALQTTLAPNGAVRLAAMLTILVGAGAAIIYRPALVPLSIYLLTIPFEALLTTSDGTVTKYVGILASGIVLLVLTDYRRAVSPPAAVYGWGAFTLLNLFSLMWSEDPFYRTGFFVMMSQLYAIYAICSMLRVTVLEVKVFLGCSLFSGVVLSTIGVWMFTHGINIQNNVTSLRLNIAGGIDPDHFGATLILPTALALGGVLVSRSIGVRLVFAALFLTLLAGIFVSGTRGALVAVAGMLVYVGIFYGYRITTAVVGSVGVIASFAFPTLYARIADASQGEAGSRYGIWRIGWDAFTHHPLLGIGTGQFQLAYGESYIRAASGQMVHRWAEDAHNVIVSTGVELGAVGVISLLVAWFLQIRVTSNIPRASRLFGARIACEAAAVGLFIDALSLDLMFRKYIWVAFMLGVLVRNAYINDPIINIEKTRNQSKALSRSSDPRVAPAAS